MNTQARKLHELNAIGDGTEIASVEQYVMKHWPDAMVGVLGIFEGYTACVHAWACGFAYALHIIEDNGIPIDLDEVLHGWEGEKGEGFDLHNKLIEYMKAEYPDYYIGSSE